MSDRIPPLGWILPSDEIQDECNMPYTPEQWDAMIEEGKNEPQIPTHSLVKIREAAGVDAVAAFEHFLKGRELRRDANKSN